MSEETKLYTVGLAVNDENGQFTHKLSAVTINDGNDPAFLLELEGDELQIDYFRTGRRSGALPSFLLNRLTFICHSYNHWYGNVCWDVFKMDRIKVVRLCETLRAHKWSATSGESEIFTAYNNGWPMVAWVERKQAP